MEYNYGNTSGLYKFIEKKQIKWNHKDKAVERVIGKYREIPLGAIRTMPYGIKY